MRCARQRVERHSAIGHVVLAEKGATGLFADGTSAGISVIGVEHDTAALRVKLEDTGDHARQHHRRASAVHEAQVGNGGMHADVVWIGVEAWPDRILCGPVQFDIGERPTTKVADQRTRILTPTSIPQTPTCCLTIWSCAGARVTVTSSGS